jgi:hypothetical protein
MKKKISTISTYELYKSIRGSWEGVIPVTKIEPNKKHYNRKKQKAELKKWTKERDIE